MQRYFSLKNKKHSIFVFQPSSMLEIISLVLLVVCALLLLAIFFKKADSNTAALQSKIQELEKGLQKIEVALKKFKAIKGDWFKN